VDPQGEPRRRRSAEEARRLILDAAQKRLIERGPDAIRLKDIADDLGISHPAILHHFGSRDGLITALDERAILALTDDVARILQLGTGEAPSGVEVVERLAQAMEQEGLARLIAWWALRPSTSEAASLNPAELVAQVAQLLSARIREFEVADAPTLEELTFAVRLAVVAMFGDALVGHELSLAPPTEQDAERHRFREWFAHLLLNQVARGAFPKQEAS
jgi:AcrR family transcriptional regulator